MKCEKLDVWKKSARLSSNVYKAFKECKDLNSGGLKIRSLVRDFLYLVILPKEWKKSLLKSKLNFLILQKVQQQNLQHKLIGMDIGYIDKKEGKVWVEESDHILSMLSNLQKTIREK